MALEYHLDLVTSLSGDELLRRLAGGGASGAPTRAGARAGPDPAFVDTGVEATAGPCSTARRTLQRDALGTDASVTITFVLDKFGDIGEERRAILAWTGRLLRQHLGDAVLRLGGEVVLLYRRAGQVVVNAESDLFSEEDLASLDVACERRTIPWL